MLINGIFFNQGHVCCAGSRLFVQESVVDEVVQKLKDRMEDEKPDEGEAEEPMDDEETPAVEPSGDADDGGVEKEAQAEEGNVEDAMDDEDTPGEGKRPQMEEDQSQEEEEGGTWNRRTSGAIGRKPHVGDLVLVHQDTPRGSWPLARITRLVQGDDGESRAAEILIRGRRTTRALHLLHLLEAAALDGPAETATTQGAEDREIIPRPDPTRVNPPQQRLPPLHV